MPLSKKRMRDRKKSDRKSNLIIIGDDSLALREVYVKAMSNLTDANVKPTGLQGVSNPVQPKTRSAFPIAELISKAWAVPVNQPPIYNPRKHQEGDVVRKWSNGKWIEVTVPALDMDGNVIGDMC